MRQPNLTCPSLSKNLILLTPLYSKGGKDTEIVRGEGILQSLQFWFRAFAGALVNAPAAAAINPPPHPGWQPIKQLQDRLFGSTSGAGKWLWDISEGTVTTSTSYETPAFQEIAGRGWNRDTQSYKLPTRQYIEAGSTFTLSALRPRNVEANSPDWVMIKSLLDWWALAGSFGGRQHFGFGAVSDDIGNGNAPADLADLATRLTTAIRSCQDAAAALVNAPLQQHAASSAYPVVTSGCFQIKVVPLDAAWSTDAVFEKIRQLWKPYRTPNDGNGRIDLQTAAEFGLPLAYTGRGANGIERRFFNVTRQHVVGGTIARRPSQIWFRPIRIGKDAGALIVMRWRTQFLPAGAAASPAGNLPVGVAPALEDFWQSERWATKHNAIRVKWA